MDVTKQRRREQSVTYESTGALLRPVILHKHTQQRGTFIQSLTQMVLVEFLKMFQELYQVQSFTGIQLCVSVTWMDDFCTKPLPLCPQMILFSACCICGLIGGILNFQFVKAVSKRPDSMGSLHLAAMTLACLGKSCDPDGLQRVTHQVRGPFIDEKCRAPGQATITDTTFLHLLVSLTYSQLPRNYLLYLIHLAHLPSGQLGAAADVPRAGALFAPLPRDDREGRRTVAPREMAFSRLW